VIYLFIHQNFPGQYQHLARYLAIQPGARVFFITQPSQNSIPRVTKLVYKPEIPKQFGCHPNTIGFDLAVRNGMSVAEICRDLKGQGIVPDIIAGHAGWGETLFVKDVFPETPILSYFEFYYHFSDVDLGFDPEFPWQPEDAFRLRTRNAVNLLSFDAADWGNTATQWQRSLYPPELRPRITRIHEGVDTDMVKSDSAAWIRLERTGLTLTREHEVVTYVARNLEPYRGFHVFMRAAPEIMRRRPETHIVVVGGDDVSYGVPPPEGTTYRRLMMDEVGGALDLDRIHFLGPVPYNLYLDILQVSSVHVYLTYPFVLSWSFIEAMASGCAIVGSATPPVEEVLQNGVNGLLVDFFSTDGIADRVDQVLDHADRMQEMRDAARATAIRNFDLKTRIMPSWLQLMDDLINHRRPSRDLPPPLKRNGPREQDG
jgi:glycosyltransferase involved in cell wall biosynthesis